MAMFENIGVFFKRFMQNDRKELLAENTVSQSKDTAKDRLHIVLMQDRANVSADFLEMMKEEIIEVIKKYIVVDESKIDVRLTNEENEDGSIGAPLLRANIPILNIRNDLKGEYMYNTVTHTIENVKNDVENEEDQEDQETEQVKEENLEEQEKTETVEENENKENQDNTVEAQVEDIPTEDVQTEDTQIEDSQEEYDDELDDDVTFDDLLKAAEEEDERMKKESEEDNKKENQKEEKKVTKKSNPNTTNKKRKKTSKTKKNK